MASVVTAESIQGRTFEKSKNRCRADLRVFDSHLYRAVTHYHVDLDPVQYSSQDQYLENCIDLIHRSLRKSPQKVSGHDLMSMSTDRYSTQHVSIGDA